MLLSFVLTVHMNCFLLHFLSMYCFKLLSIFDGLQDNGKDGKRIIKRVSFWIKHPPKRINKRPLVFFFGKLNITKLKFEEG